MGRRRHGPRQGRPAGEEAPGSRPRSTAAAPDLCPRCGTGLDLATLVTCDACKASCHRDCWILYGGCPTAGCRAALPEPDPGERERDGARRVKAAMAEARDLSVDGRARASAFLRTDLETPLEFAATFLAAASFYLAFVVFFVALFEGVGWTWFCILAVTAWGFWEIERNLDCTYVVDLPGRAVWFHRSLGGLATCSRVASFDEIHCTTVDGARTVTRRGEVWHYHALLVTRTGRRIPVSDPTDRIAEANRRAAALSSHLRVRFVVGKSARCLRVERDRETRAWGVRHEPHDTWRSARSALQAVGWALFCLLMLGILVSACAGGAGRR